MTNPWAHIPIIECDEKVCEIPANDFVRADPHPYMAQGAIYEDGMSPFMVREGVLDRLYKAQTILSTRLPGYRFKIFDALRPLAVQKQMVEISFCAIARKCGLDPENLCDEDSARVMDETMLYWSAPVDDLSRPPLHSTGGAIDLTIVDNHGRELDMGTPFDWLEKESATMHFAHAGGGHHKRIHTNRMLLVRVMEAAGFTVHPNEWWHFDYGDQRHALQLKLPHAWYGKVTSAHLPKLVA